MKISARYIMEFEEWLREKGYSESYIKELISVLSSTKSTRSMSKSRRQKLRAAKFLYSVFMRERH